LAAKGLTIPPESEIWAPMLNQSESAVEYFIGGRGFGVGQDARARFSEALSLSCPGFYSRTYTNQVKLALPRNRTSISLCIWLLPTNEGTRLSMK
jgi:hypothetical protein